MAFEDMIDITPQQLQVKIMEYLEEAIKRNEEYHKDTLEEYPYINLYRFAHIIIKDVLEKDGRFDDYMEYYVTDHGYYIWDEDKTRAGKE